MRLVVLGSSLLLVLAPSAASVTPPPLPQPVDGFHAQRTECIVFEGYHGLQLYCGVTGRARRVEMNPQGRAQSWRDEVKADPADYGSLLRVGRTWRFRRAFRCDHTPKLIRCRNRSGHGWTIGSRGRARLF